MVPQANSTLHLKTNIFIIGWRLLFLKFGYNLFFFLSLSGGHKERLIFTSFIRQKHNISDHSYADDTLLHISPSHNNLSPIDDPVNCITDIRHFLQLNNERLRSFWEVQEVKDRRSTPN